MIRLAVTGFKGSGKSTVALMLAKQLNLKVMAFAGPMKQTCAAVFNIPLHEFYDPKLKDEYDRH